MRVQEDNPLTVPLKQIKVLMMIEIPNSERCEKTEIKPSMISTIVIIILSLLN